MNLPSFAQILTLEQVGEDRFTGTTPPGAFALGWVFGGQLLGQALSAAIATTEGRPFHSFHAYYLSAGRSDRPIEYEVERVRDGGTFAARRVVASQDGRQVLQMLSSFKTGEQGLVHQDTMPQVPGPESFEPDANRAMWEEAMVGFPFEIRRITPAGRPIPPDSPASQRMWVRARAPLDARSEVQDAALAYLADYGMLATMMIPHEMAWNGANGRSTSLDQAVWRYCPSDLRQWHLMDLHSPGARDARGFGVGSIWRQDGTLVATIAQEGFMRAA